MIGIPQLLKLHTRVQRITANCWSIRAESLLQVSETQELKASILEIVLLSEPISVLVFDEDPLTEGVRGSWEKHAENRWLMPRDGHVDEMLQWLRPGNWVIYNAQKHPNAAQLRQIASNEASMVESAARSVGASLTISSFHDNDPWFLYCPDIS